MIEITVELKSAITGERTVIGRATIVNDATGTHSRGNYGAVFAGKTARYVRYSRIENFPRLRKNVWDLLQLALQNRVKIPPLPVSKNGFFYYVLPETIAPRFDSKYPYGRVILAKRHGKGTSSRYVTPRGHVPALRLTAMPRPRADVENIRPTPKRSSVAPGRRSARKSKRSAR